MFRVVIWVTPKVEKPISASSQIDIGGNLSAAVKRRFSSRDEPVEWHWLSTDMSSSAAVVVDIHVPMRYWVTVANWKGDRLTNLVRDLLLQFAGEEGWPSVDFRFISTPADHLVIVK